MSAEQQPKSKTSRKRLSPVGQRILKACLEQPTLERAAAAAGVSAATVWRYRQRPEYQQALHEIGERGIAQATARIQQVTLAAANEKIRMLMDPKTPESVRARVAERILSHAQKALERENLDKRVAALEQTCERQQGPQLVSKSDDPDSSASKTRMPGKLSVRQQKVLIALLEHQTDEKTALAVGVTAQTVARCRKVPEFDRAYFEARKMGVQQALIRLQQATPLAVSVLWQLMTASTTPHATRERAIETWFRFGIRTVETDGCQLRLSELESRMQPNAAKIRRAA